MPRISVGERRFVEGSVAEGVRHDGRAALDLRHLVIQQGVVEFCNGSTLIERVHTAAKVLVGVKAQVRDLQRTEDNLKPLVDISVDCTSLGAREEDASQRRVRELARNLEDQVQGQVDQMLRGREPLLDIVPNRFVWSLSVDIIVLGSDGNLPDLISLAVFAALGNVRLPSAKTVESEEGLDFEINPDTSAAVRLPNDLLAAIPMRVTLFKVAQTMVADVSEQEELCSDCALSVLVTRDGKISSSSIQESGSVPLAELAGHLGNACQIAAELFKLLDRELSET